MTNTAKILNFGRGNFAGQERNVADLDDGYARLSNMLLEAYSGADLTKRQFKVLLAILRKTYGWNKPMDRITDSQLSEITKLPVKRCNEAKLNRPGFPGECFICELRLPDHRFRWKHNKLFLLLPEEYGPAFPAIVDCYTSPPT